MRPRSATPPNPLGRLALACACLAGCAPLHLGARRASSLVTPPTPISPLAKAAASSPAEAWYAEAVQLDDAGSATAVDAYLQAAVAAWPAVEMLARSLQTESALARATFSGAVDDSREWDLYQSAVAGLVTAAQKHGRWNPATGLLTAAPLGVAPVETTFHGFLWAPTEFGVLHPVADDSPARLLRVYRRPGLGVPLVVERNDAGAVRPFIEIGREFAATALVRPVLTPAGPTVRLEFHDPLRRTHVDLGGGAAAPLAANLSAPLNRGGVNYRQAWLEPFLRPSAAGSADRLEMLEPFQPDKIPVLFVHGLLSDPATWSDMINELQAQPQVVARYQFWTFRYDTGAPFLTSAASLRRQLAELLAYYDPQGCDPRTANMVIVGHSMGGLIANLQVAYSGDALWNAAVHVPLDQLYTDAETRAALADAFFFAPSDRIARIVYIGTPHLGSGFARRAVGSLGSALVQPAEISQQRQAQLARDNPGALGPELSYRFPTSVDLLDPRSPILNATARLPYRAGVAAHSIIGAGFYTLGSGPSDGVVPVASARLAGVASELVVPVRHAQQPHHDEVIAEVVRILSDHAAIVEATDGQPARFP